MTPIQLRITNFGPFKGTQTFEFPAKPGLYFLWGRNEEEPQLEANGAGKSKLWDALTWLIYGKTGKGLKAGDVSTWEVGKSTVVEFIYLNGNGAPCRVRRTWAPISWTYECSDNGADEADFQGDGFKPVDLARKDADNPFLADLALEFTPFLHSVLMAQGLPTFLDLGPTEKAALFAAVMNLDSWLDRSKKAGEQAQVKDREARALENSLSRLQGRVAAWEDDREVADQAEKWEADRNKRLDALSDSHKRGLDDLDKLKTDIDAAGADLVREEAERDKANDRKADCLERLQKWEGHLRDATRECAKAEQTAETAERFLASLKYDERCPSCRQKIDRTHISLHSKANDEAAVKLRLLRIAERDNQEAVDQYKKHYEDAAHEAQVAKEIVTNTARTISSRRADLQRLNRDLDEIEEEAENLHAVANPYKALQDSKARELADLRTQLRRAEYDLDNLLGDHAMLMNWTRWFKEIRLQLIGEALQQLEIEVNSCLAELGLINWELRFDIDKESKSGSITRGFAVTVVSPHNDRPVPWEAWSGGESQRLRLAATQGLGNLIRARSSTALDLEVWDEPTQWLSPQGVQDLLEALRGRADREQRQIWIVDHRTLGFAGFSGQAGVVKTKSGSSFVYP